MEADRAFAADVREGGSEAWASWFAEDGAMVRPGDGEVRGREAVRTAMAGLDAPGVSLQWEPDRAEIAASGDLGWTTGSFVSEGPGPDGEIVRGEGRYVSIWRLQEDGSWKVVMDLGNPTGQPPG
jgi:ketosteroid isomerase-like protein